MDLKTPLNSVKEALLSFIYPPHCIHCHERLENNKGLFCSPCLSLLDILEVKKRCSRCFSEKFNDREKHCLVCKNHPSYLHRQAAVFEYLGPAASLIKKMKYSQQPFLATGGGSYMVLQWAQLEWPIPDMIIPVPMALTHWFERGYNQSELLAKSMSSHMNVPFVNALARRSGDYSQAGLNLNQRKELNSNRFFLKSGHSLHDKTVLLVDDVVTSGSTLNRCAEVLLEGCPKEILGLALCKA